MTKNLRTELMDFMYDVWSPPAKRSRPNPKDFEKVITRIRSEGQDELIVRLFEEVGADYRDPWVWYALMGRFAEALYDVKRGGRPRKYFKPSDTILRRDYQATAQQCRPNEKAAVICEKMKKRFVRKYGDVQLGTLLTWVSNAGAVRAVKIARKSTNSEPRS
jgi:hypothetical protein